MVQLNEKVSIMKWKPLNPDIKGSPMALTIHKGEDKEVMLLKFKPNHKSPVHAHSSSYIGIVLDGEVSNYHPDQEPELMGQGMRYSQPSGGAHITGAGEDGAILYVEFDGSFDNTEPTNDDKPTILESDETKPLHMFSDFLEIG